MALVSAFFDILQRPSFEDLIFELMIFMVPFWAAVVVGILVGWAWRPKWVNTSTNFLDCTAKKGESHESVMACAQFAASLSRLSSLKSHLPACIRGNYEAGLEKENIYLASVSSEDFSSSKLESGISDIVNVDDLKHLHKLVENKDEGPSWIHMMDKSTNNMSYQAWRRDAETGPPQYRSRTVYEDATPEMLRDFFWDDEFRLKWDDMIVSAETLEECRATGTTVVHWVRKFPFFCSDREYIIGRRIWDSGRSYYCVTKGIPRSSVPRRDKPRRVDLYYSSWCIRAAESKRDGRLTACEVLLFHHEDMGIPREIAKLGIRQGMWGAVRKIDPALRAYQKLRASKAQLSRSALMAQINTKVDVDTEVEALDSTSISSEFDPAVSAEKTSGRSLTKILIVGGAIAFALSLDRGFLTKAVVFGVARKFGNAGKRLRFV